MTQTCYFCGTVFETKQAYVNAGKGKYCSRGCYAESLRGPRSAGVKHRMRKAPGHPIAPPSGTVAISRIVLYDAIGPGRHSCHWCGEIVEWRPGAGIRDPQALVVDHLDRDPTNDELTNLVPSCNMCNAHRTIDGRRDRLRYADTVKTLGSGVRVRAIERSCESCAAAFLARPADLVRGKGRFCSRSCARRRPKV